VALCGRRARLVLRRVQRVAAASISLQGVSRKITDQVLSNKEKTMYIVPNIPHLKTTALAGVLAISLAGCGASEPAPPVENAVAPVITAPPKMTEKSEAQPAAVPANAQNITVELPLGYKSGAATVKAGTPVAITFKLTKDADCGNVITVPAANWKKTLKVGESATMVYTPKKTGELQFACSMDHMKGTLIVK
jgi:plastocyanin